MIIKLLLFVVFAAVVTAIGNLLFSVVQKRKQVFQKIEEDKELMSQISLYSQKIAKNGPLDGYSAQQQKDAVLILLNEKMSLQEQLEAIRDIALNKPEMTVIC